MKQYFCFISKYTFVAISFVLICCPLICDAVKQNESEIIGQNQFVFLNFSVRALKALFLWKPDVDRANSNQDGAFLIQNIADTLKQGLLRKTGDNNCLPLTCTSSEVDHLFLSSTSGDKWLM